MALSKTYRVFFHRGDELGLNTRVSKGKAWVDGTGLNIEGTTENIFIAGPEFQSIELFRLHGMGRVIRVDHRGGRLFLAVIRLMLGQFALVNFFRTGELHKALTGLAKSD
jgi:hypothetical protein